MPDWRPGLQRRLDGLPVTPPRAREILDELTQHLDEHYRDLVARGLEPAEAERLTRLELDRAALLPTRLPATPTTRPARQPWTAAAGRALAGIGQDARFALRLFQRRAGVMSLALAGLAAAIALATVIFSALNALALRPMAVPHPEQVVNVDQFGAGIDGWTFAGFQRLRAAATRLQAEAWWVRIAPPSPDFEAGWHESVPMHFVGATFLETFGGRVAHGRLLVTDDHSFSSPVRAVVSHAFWARRLAADPAVVGRTVTIGQTPVTIVGIAASSFGGPSSHWDAPAAFWLPIEKREAFEATPSPFTPGQRPVFIVARLREPVSIAAAQARSRGDCRR